MKLNEDTVPMNLEEALLILKAGLSADDIAELKKSNFDSVQLHFTVGMMLRNAWSLWEKDTILVEWFKREYGINHADDISGLILDCLWKDINNKPRQDKELAKQFIQHWKNQK